MFNFFDGLIDAATKLKKAVPLMVKYRVAPNPMNYAIWYNYVSGAVPEMNKELDETIVKYGTCPPTVAEKLFKTHLADNVQADTFDQANHGLSDIAGEMKKNAAILTAGTKVYEKVLSDALSSFDTEVSSNGIHPAILDLVDKTGSFLEQNVEFQFRLDDAQRKIKKLQNEVKTARQDSYTDPLTTLYNRRYFDQRIENMLSDDTKTPYCLIMLDIDDFKRINDSYGHMLGDLVIQRIAEIIKLHGNDLCVPARLGGEEFALLVPKAGIIDALKLAEKMRACVSKILITSKRDPSIRLTITSSFGVAQLKAQDKAEDFIDRADKALYKAKSEGKNRVSAL